MDEKRYEFGVHARFLEGLISDRWETESVKSSRVDIIPSAANLIKKEKKGRRLDKLVYEVFSTIFLSELFDIYNTLFQSGDFTLYSPQTIGFTYDGSSDDPKDWTSVLYEFFCPGTPLNKIDNPRRKSLVIGENSVRAGERISYLTGIAYEVFLREGFSHGDPHLRHFIMMPSRGSLIRMRGEEIITLEPRNGMGVIDLEKCSLTGPYSSIAIDNGEMLKERLFRRFTHNSAEKYFDKGRKIVSDESGSGIHNREAYERALRIFRERFTYIAGVDLESRRVLFDP